MTKVIDNNVLREMTSEEETEHEALKAELIAKKEERATAKAEQDAIKASGNQKLLDLGLSQAEATALTGYTPE
jgi:hypothetical protein